ncbi:MAG: hypothetical protein QM655_11250 [Nocardioidaceae bacterium]
MTMLLDAGALIAVERGDAVMWRRLRIATDDVAPVITHGGIVGQVWRGGGRQALLARALAGVSVIPIDVQLGKATGELLAVSSTSDVNDAALALLANPGDQVITSDPDDLGRLLATRRVDVEILSV